jgi:hypothetical protein
MEGKESDCSFTTSRGGFEGGDGRRGKWLLIYNLLWRIGGWGWKERKVVANLQLPVEDWRLGMEGKESGC